jgi:hypothetical protein
MPFVDDGFEALLEPFYNGKKLTDPIKTTEDKFQLLPAFLKVKGLVKQHIDSYNFFVDHEIKEIVRMNRTIKSDVESNFWLEYVRPLPMLRLRELTHIRAGSPISASELLAVSISTMFEPITKSRRWSAASAI